MAYEWEPAYGMTATDRTSNVALAAALEQVRRRRCAYGSVGEQTCDCKYGATPIGVADPDRSESTGCPELREVIQRLLYRPESFTRGPLTPDEHRARLGIPPGGLD